MRLYVAYKYTNISDKKTLQDTLENMSNKLVSLGHTTFILGRDIQKWRGSNHPFLTTIQIIKNMRKADAVLVFFDTDLPSKGLSVELNLARYLNKRVYFLLNENVKFKPKVDESMIIVYSDYSDLVNKLERIK